MRAKRITACLLGGMMAASVLMGCGGVDKNATVATFDETRVPLGVANFAARLQQASYDDFYVAYFGEDVWSSDLYGDGSTMADSVKTNVLDSLFTMYTLEAHRAEYGVELTAEDEAAIAEAVSGFLAANSGDALAALGADRETVERYLVLNTIQSRMHNAIIAQADVEVSDAEANTSAYSYVRVSKTSYTDAEGNTAEYDEAGLEELVATIEAFDAEAKEGTLEDAADAYGYTVNTGTFTADDEYLDEAVLTALRGMAEGEISEVIDTENWYYVVRLDAETDAEATENTKTSIIAQRQSDLYNEVLEGWKEGHTWTTDEKVWATVTFDNLFTTVAPGTETEEAENTEQ